MSEGGRQVGFVGIGTIGKPMALNVLKRGHTLTVFDLNQAAVAELIAAGRMTRRARHNAERGSMPSCPTSRIRWCARAIPGSRPSCGRRIARICRASTSG